MTTLSFFLLLAATPEAPLPDAGLELVSPAAPAPALPAPEDELPSMEVLDALADQAVGDSEAGREELKRLVHRLAEGSTVRDGLEAALAGAEASGQDLPFALPKINDLAAFDVATVRDRYDIPVEMQPLVAQYIRFFQGAGRRWFRRWMSRAARFIPLMQPILEAKGLPRDTVYLAMIESGFNTQARSWARAVGPWQFIAATGKTYGLKQDFWVDERRDPVKATHAAADYLAALHTSLGHWYLAWAGYNSGGGRVRSMIQRFGTLDFWQLIEQRRGFARETKHYVPKLIACALVAKHPEAFGFDGSEFPPEPPFEFDEVPLTDAVDLEVLAQAAGTQVEVLTELNPELLRWSTPPATPERPYLLRLPPGTRPAFQEAYAQVAPTERLHYAVHRVVKGDTLSRIAQRYRSATEAILRVNRLTSARKLQLHSDLVVPIPSPKAVAAGRSDPALERAVARARRQGLKASVPTEEIPAGTPVARGRVRTESVQGRQKVAYEVARGDSLWSIARRFDVHVADLREWNGELGTSRRLQPGVELTVFPGPEAKLQ